MNVHLWTITSLCVGGLLALMCLLTLLELALKTAQLGIGPTPSGRVARKLIVELCVAEQVAQASPLTLYELGSGWGGLAHSLAVALGPGAHVTGVELAWGPLLCSRAFASLSQAPPWSQKRASLTYVHQDLTTALSQLIGGELLVCYLCPEQLRRLSDTLSSVQLPQRVTLISLLFSLPGYTATERLTVNNLYRDPVWVYRLS